jgi:hypothetical protein
VLSKAQYSTTGLELIAFSVTLQGLVYNRSGMVTQPTTSLSLRTFFSLNQSLAFGFHPRSLLDEERGRVIPFTYPTVHGLICLPHCEDTHLDMFRILTLFLEFADFSYRTLTLPCSHEMLPRRN